MTYETKPVTSMEPRWNLNMTAAPLGRKVMALNPSGVAVFASLTPSTIKHFRAWCPLPKLTTEQKDEINARYS